ncbi:MAG: hypothetical protein KJ623_02105 [Nanoarchaeota archaeon]|nr:hypothetical protein [Nanoarchaeota archaeon]MBU0962781.1 hypothetical protein [Nanoarchaeota archaeon]
MEIKAKVKEWGNSLGIIIPKEIVVGEKLKPSDEIIIDIKKKTDIMKLFGKAKFKQTAQELKDEGRKGWA